MPRRLDPKPCACGCGQITKSGSFMRGHHITRKWALVKAAARFVEARELTALPTGEYVDADTVGRELRDRGWTMPDSYRHFGVELEVIAPSRESIANILRRLRVPFVEGSYHMSGGDGAWKITNDGSVYPNLANRRNGLSTGLEVVSPPLRGAKGFRTLRRVMHAFEAAGIAVNKTCGGHVHHEALDMNVEHFKTLARNYATLQAAIDRVLPASRRTAANNTYCRELGAYELQRIDTATTLSQIGYGIDRYRTLNFASYPSYGTVEFRQHAGTVSFEKLSHWILFGQGMLRAAKKGHAVFVTASLAEAFSLLGGKSETVRFFRDRANALRAA